MGIRTYFIAKITFFPVSKFLAGSTGRDPYHLVELVESYTVVCVTSKKERTLILPGLVVAPKRSLMKTVRGVPIVESDENFGRLPEVIYISK